MSNSKKGKSSDFLVQGSILAFAAIISRMIGLVYRIVLANILGDYGNDYYSGAYSVYNILLLISSYSLPLAVSKLISARVAKKQYRNAMRILKAALMFAVTSGLIVCLICFFGADFITKYVIATPMSYFALRMLAPTLFIVAVMGVIRGYFQGLGTMVPTATSQIIEQIVNAAGSIIGAMLLSAYGLKVGAVLGKPEQYSAAYGASGGTFGTGIGAFFALIFLCFILFSYKNVIKRQVKKDKTKNIESYSSIYGVLFLTIVPVILSTTIYNISDFLDQAVFKRIMIILGESVEVRSSSWGIYSAEVLTLLSVPITIASALSSSVIPSLTAALANNDRVLVKKKISTAIRFIMVISIPCAIGMGVLASPILRLTYSDARDLPANMIRIGAISIVFYSLSTLMNGILQGINKMFTPIKNAIIALIIHVITLVGCMMLFHIGIYAVVISSIVFSFLMCVFNSHAISKALRYRQEVLKTIIIPSISGAIMGGIVFLSYTGIYMILEINSIATIVSILIGVLVYGLLLLVFKEFSEEELLGLPKGRFLLKIAKKLHFYR